jgi:hypothetical protein
LVLKLRSKSFKFPRSFCIQEITSMHRLRNTLLVASLAGILFAGCDGESQPNADAALKPGAVTEDIAKKTSDMMKAANTGMDKKAMPKAGAPAKPAAPAAGATK